MLKDLIKNHVEKLYENVGVDIGLGEEESSFNINIECNRFAYVGVFCVVKQKVIFLQDSLLLKHKHESEENKLKLNNYVHKVVQVSYSDL